MTTTDRLALWTPRLMGVLAGLFLGLFALDAFSEGKPLAQALADFAVHLTPSLILLAIVVFSWRRPWIGALTFIALALLYAMTMSRGRLDWMLTISGPLLIVGVLFLWSAWRLHYHPGA
jgi:hypothetical protein